MKRTPEHQPIPYSRTMELSNSGTPESPSGDRRERIIEVATRQFAEKGFAAVRVDEIAMESGCNKQLIYYYFKNKVGVWEAALTRLIEGNVEGWKKLPGSTFDELLIRQRPQAGDPVERNRLWGQLLMREGVDYVDAETTPIHLEEQRAGAWKIQTDAVRSAQERGEIRPDMDPEMLSYFIALTRHTGRILPQVARMITGEELESPDFQARYEKFLRQLADALSPAKESTRPAPEE